MRRSALIALLAMTYAGGWTVTSSACLANQRAEFPKLWNDSYTDSREKAIRQRRMDQAFCFGWSLLPMTWPVAPFLMGFYADGFLWPWDSLETGLPAENGGTVPS